MFIFKNRKKLKENYFVVKICIKNFYYELCMGCRKKSMEVQETLPKSKNDS